MPSEKTCLLVTNINQLSCYSHKRHSLALILFGIKYSFAMSLCHRIQNFANNKCELRISSFHHGHASFLGEKTVTYMQMGGGEYEIESFFSKQRFMLLHTDH